MRKAALRDEHKEEKNEAYMNGYNWEAFLNFYLEKYFPEVMSGMSSDPEAGMYAAWYEATPENEARAKQLWEIINALIDKEEELIAFSARTETKSPGTSGEIVFRF